MEKYFIFIIFMNYKLINVVEKKLLFWKKKLLYDKKIELISDFFKNLSLIIRNLIIISVIKNCSAISCNSNLNLVRG